MSAFVSWFKTRLSERSSQIQLVVLVLMGLVAFNVITVDQLNEWAGKWSHILLLAGPALGFAVSDRKPTEDELVEMAEEAAKADPRFASVLATVVASAEAFNKATGKR